MQKCILALALAVLAGGAAAAQQTDDFGGRLLSFEESASPLSAGRGSKLLTCGEHYKHGLRSARWEWSREGAQIVLRRPIGYLAENPNPKETSVSTFVFWLYAPQAVGGELRFEFRKQGRTCARFDYGLGFTGWRGAWVAFDRDMEGTPEEGMDELVVTVRGAKRGELYLDHWIPASFQDVRHHTADFQAPFINARTNSHWLVLLKSWRRELDIAPEAAVTAEQQREMDTVLGRLQRLLLEGRKTPAMKTLRKQFADYGISRNADGTVKGKPLFFVRYAETYINLGGADMKKRLSDSRQLLRQCNDLLFQMAVRYRRSTDPAERGELAEMYLTLTRHLLDQGFAAGSGLGTLHHLGYSMRNFYTAPVLMRDVLVGAGLDGEVQRAMEWFSGVGEVKIRPEVDGIDIDAFNTSMTGRLASLLMLSDTPRKVAYLKAFSRWIDNGYKVTEGTAACFKSDGTVFHHRHHYPAYAVGGFDGAVNAVWLLNGTRFGVSPEGREVLKRALLEMRFYCNLNSFPLAMSGRHPDGEGELVPWHFGRLAEAGTSDGREEVDRELAAAYMRLVPESDARSRRFAVQGIRPEKSPEGTRVYGYNASLSHRRGDWLVTVAGHSRYVWAAEIYQGANHYGRYLTHGSLELLGDGEPVSAFGSGFRREGWDWCHIPGTTALEIPMERLKANVLNVDTCSGYEEMLLSDESFAGGVTHRGRSGAYGLKLHEHDKYNGSLRARKSWFLFDNRVICLGSDIENDAEGGLHTTLFQNFLPSSDAPVFVDGEQVTELPCRIDRNGSVQLVDGCGNAWFVPQGKVTVRRSRQRTPHEETDAPTENDFATAWIDHGSGRVRDGRYEYMVAVHPSDAERAEYAYRAPYRVVSADRNCHAVVDLGSGTLGAAVFEPGDVENGGAVRSVSLPCLYMESRDGAELTLSVADPDLRFYEGESDERFDADGRRIERSIYSRDWIDNPSLPSALSVTLAGRWELAEPSAHCRIATSDASATTLEFTCREGATREVKLLEKR
ncbi:chondroitinase family polysaccharide lyase [uncultured Alistipes sp.]|uniref:chondroitinase family polysaccharide lyase n=1 Tax=uncultured Alistipes sp. TaxID=538949 RepID=UPI0032B100A5